jgi:transposase
MEVIYERVAGLDVHKKTVVVNLLTPEKSETRTYKAVTNQIRKMAQWLLSKDVTHVAMESTGIYWKPIWNLLEALKEIKLLLVNAKEVKNVPGRKTDVKDAEWLAMLLSRGLLSACYVPDREQRELRELTRFRRKVVGERASLYQRADKVLESCNIRVSSVLSKVWTKSGIRIIHALAGGETAPETLAALADRRVKASKEELEEALEGLVDVHQRFMLSRLLELIEAHTRTIEELDEEVAQRLRPFEELIQRMDEVPGIDVRAAQDILAEVGTSDWLEVFSTPEKLLSWAKLSPGNFLSAGKRKGGKWQQGKSPYIHSIMFQVAKSASRTKGSYSMALYKRLAARRGSGRAWGALASSILEALYHMQTRQTRYHELGGDYFERLREERIVKHSVSRLEKLGYEVSIKKRPEVQPAA